MSEMIERVAKAISISFHEEGYIEGQDDPSLWAEFQKAARAAIAAMREPSEMMMDAGYTAMRPVFEGEHCEPNPSDNGNAYRAMIDAALEGK